MPAYVNVRQTPELSMLTLILIDCQRTAAILRRHTTERGGMNLPTALLIVSGLPYAGKSAVSADLARELGDAQHIEVDQINIERGFGAGGEAVPMTEWSTTYQEAYERSASALAEGTTVIFDAGNASRAQRDILRSHAYRAGVETAVIFVATSEDTCRSRWQADPQAMDEFSFERAVERFDAPQAGEQVVVYLPGMGVSDLVSGLRQIFGQ